MWLCVITLISQQVSSKLVTANTTSGSDSTKCCVDGECGCSSLSTALCGLNSNTIILRQLESVTPNNAIELSNLTQITIAGNNATVMCNNKGSVYCKSCDNVVIEGITWDGCGIPEMTPT